jgi:hypothetical protein
MKRALLCITFIAYATTSLAEVHVQIIRGRFCTAAAPQGWTVAAENPTGSAFGADLTRSDGAALASYLIFGVPAQMRSSPVYQQWYVTPERAVLAQLTQFGAKPMSCNRPAELLAGSGYMGMACQSPALKGLVAYKVFGAGDGGYVVLMRTAGAPHATWNRYGTEATAVARSVQCQVPLLPSRTGSDMPSPPKKGKKKSEDSEYSPWLGTEPYHDATTGENYSVSPSRDWNETGSQGPGYYTRIGNDTRKLEPGLSQ